MRPARHTGLPPAVALPAVALIVAAAALGACQTANAPRSADPVGAATELAPRQLSPGACGLFVWRSSPEKPFLLFSSETEGAFHDGTSERAFTPNDAPLSPAQTLSIEGTEWTLALSDRDTYAGGARYNRGTLTATDAEGWRTVIPVVGFSACAADTTG